MRVPNDLRLAREVPELHMILGGHDHHYEYQQVSRVHIQHVGGQPLGYPLEHWEVHVVAHYVNM